MQRIDGDMDMQQIPLLIEDADDALRECARALGGLKSVGALLRPDMEPDAAGRWLADSLNPSRRERLDWRQALVILREARKVGYHAGMHFIARDCGYEEPRAVEPEDETAALQREFIAGVKRMEQIAARLRTLPTPAGNARTDKQGQRHG